MATRHPGSKMMAEAVEVSPTTQASALGSLQQQQPPPGFIAVEGVPVAQATTRPLAYVGIPLDDDEEGCPAGASSSSPLLPPPPRSGGEATGARGRVHGDVNLGVGRDMAGAEEAARARAREDNAAFVEKRGVTQSQALSRVAEDRRAIEVARINAKRRDSEGLDMRPHPGNRLDPPRPSPGEKGWAYEAGSAKWAAEKEASGAGAGAGAGGGGGGGGGGGATGGEGESGQEETGSSEGYQCAEYEPAEYVIPEYKSVYDK